MRVLGEAGRFFLRGPALPKVYMADARMTVNLSYIWVSVCEISNVRADPNKFGDLN